MGIRVLRVIEYEYVDAEAAAEDMQRWTTGHINPRMRMRSATLPFATIEFETETEGK